MRPEPRAISISRPRPTLALPLALCLAAVGGGALAATGCGARSTPPRSAATGPGGPEIPGAPDASPVALSPSSDAIDIDGITALGAARLGSIAIRKWRLRNGLQVITAPDAAARSVSYVTAYRVGSRDENAAAGETGLAHLCEHLMFASAAAAGGPSTFDRRLEEQGGSGNATTFYDFTAYTDDIPASALDRTIRLEAERMAQLPLTDGDVAREREIVIEERLQSAEDDIDGQLDERVFGQAFRTHPYRWPIVGRLADIQAATLARVADFHQRHYAPERAIVVVAGRFDEARALAAIGAAYGPLAPGTLPPAAEPAPERAPDREIRASIARAVPAERFMIGYPAPGLGDPDRAAYELVDEILAGGPSSRLYRALVVNRDLASSVRGELAPTRDPGLWTLVVQMSKGNPSAGAEELIAREIARLAAEAVPAPELAAARNRLETAFWHTLASSQERAMSLGEFDVVTGDFRNLIERGGAYARISATDVTRVARAYLGPGARSIVVAHPVNEAGP